MYRKQKLKNSMASSSSSDDDVIIITVTNPSDQTDSQSLVDEEMIISTEEIQIWDLPTILSNRTALKVRALRSTLVEHSSYFHGMLNWSFSESGLDGISIDWDIEAFANILKCIYGCSIDIASDNFVPLYEGALYFGVGILLEKCSTWFSEVVSSSAPPQIRLEDLISIWSFSFEHVSDVLPCLCADYLARNFMWAMSCESFDYLPFSLLESGIKHQHLTVESEKHLCDAIFNWLEANTGGTEGSSGSVNNYMNILKQIHPSLLPLRFVAGKRRSSYSNKFASESISSIFGLLNFPVTGSISLLDDFDLNGFRIRLTEYSTKLNLSSCPQISSAIFLLSVLPPLHSIDSTLGKSIKQTLIKLDSSDAERFRDSWDSWPLFSFKAVEEVDISRCWGLNLHAAIMCFSISFASLKKLKAAHFSNFNIKTFRQLFYNCPMLLELDVTLDMSPFIREQGSYNFPTVSDTPTDISIWKSEPTSSNITRLILEGRSELCDSDLNYISKLGIGLQYLNIRGCTTLTDLGISTLIRRHVKLKSILACHTSFGLNSVLALSSLPRCCSNSSAPISECMAFNLHILHIGGCMGIDETFLLKLLSGTRMLRSLCVRDTYLTDRVLYSISGSGLEMLDVCNTMVSGAAISRVVYDNPGLKCLRVQGCKNLCQRESDDASKSVYLLNHCGELEVALGKTCRLEEISIGWGFSHFSMEALKPALTSLKEITVGLGGSLGEDGLTQLPKGCPNLKSIILHFQVISDSTIINIMESLRNLEVLALCYCFGDISISGFLFSMPKLRKLQLERVAPWMTNKDLFILTENCPELVHLSLLGCPYLDSDSQLIIANGWPGLVSLHLEECGEVTANGISSFLDCVALEDLLLRHNGPGIQGSVVLDSVSKLPLLRKVSLDLCDSVHGYFDIPSDDQCCFIRSVKIAKCKLKECGLSVQFVEPRRKPVHKETLVLERTGKTFIRKVVEDRL